MSLPRVSARSSPTLPFGAEAPPSVPPRPVESSATPSRMPGPTEEGPSPFARVLRGLAREIDGGERATRDALRGAASGRDLSSTELIALQGRIYRYSEAVDLAARLVDRTTNGVRTVIQGQ